MAAGQLSPVLRFIRKLQCDFGLSDRELLQRFTEAEDEMAFTALVRRHGPMVLGVCRRLLRDSNDVEDAFQATFLLLVRKAHSLRHPDALGPWLHGVARRTAAKARSLAARRRSHEFPIQDVPAEPTPDDVVWSDLRPVLDDAINRLPRKYRVPFVLCHLQGLTNAQAARQLGCSPGTIATWLARARERLRVRLTRKGITLSAGLLTATLAKEAAARSVPPALLSGTVRCALALLAGKAAALSVPIIGLMKGVGQAMFLDKLKIVMAVLLLTSVGGTGAGVMVYRATAAQAGASAQQKERATIPPQRAEQDEGPGTYRTENFVVEAPTRSVARIVAESAERERKAKAVLWTGKEMPRWTEPCPIKVTIADRLSPGATTFSFQDGKVTSQSMKLEGPLDRILAGNLPHEVTHTILAHFFGKPIPRWADEGAAVLSEDEKEQRRYEKLARQIVPIPGRMIPLRRLFALREYPSDREELFTFWLGFFDDGASPQSAKTRPGEIIKHTPSELLTFFAESYSVTRFLIERENRPKAEGFSNDFNPPRSLVKHKNYPTFLEFVKQGMREDWDNALQNHYGIASVEELEKAYMGEPTSIPEGSPKPAPLPYPPPGSHSPIPPPIPLPMRIFPFEPVPPYARPPLTAMASVDEKGQLTVRFFISSWVDEQQQAGQSYKRSIEETSTQAFHLKDVQAYYADGRPIDKMDICELLQKENPVLVSGLKVHPFHLQLVKEGTIIIVAPLKPYRNELSSPQPVQLPHAPALPIPPPTK